MNHSTTAEQILWHRLSVFAGSFAQEAAEAVCAGESIERSAVPDLLARLTEQSLLVIEKQGKETRYQVPGPLLQVARRRLADSGETDILQKRLADYCLALAEEAQQYLSGPGRVEWVARLEQEHENLRASLCWSVEGGRAEEGLQLAVALRDFWRHHMFEGREWFAELLALPQASPQTPIRAHALDVAGTLAFYAAYQNEDAESAGAQADAEACRSLLEESLAIFRTLGDKDGCATSLIHIGTRQRLLEGDYAGARASFEECLGLCRELGDDNGDHLLDCPPGLPGHGRG